MSGKALITVGATTSHGGVVLTGSATTSVNGAPVACNGDTATCPIPGHGGVTTIIGTNVHFVIDGKPTAVEDDKTTCGASLIAVQYLLVDDAGMSAPS